MTFNRNKIIAVLMIVSPIIGIFPIKPTGLLKPDADFNLLIKNCDKDGNSVFFKIVEGRLTLNDTVFSKNKNIYKDTITITLGSTPKRIKNNEILVNGSIVSILQHENNHVIHYEIFDWKTKKYIPRFVTWSLFDWVTNSICYIICCISGVFILSKKT